MVVVIGIPDFTSRDGADSSVVRDADAAGYIKGIEPLFDPYPGSTRNSVRVFLYAAERESRKPTVSSGEAASSTLNEAME